MVSNASEDLPEPDSPVTTTRASRGRSTSTFLRLCTRAPRTAIQSWDIGVDFVLRPKRPYYRALARERRPFSAGLRPAHGADEQPPAKPLIGDAAETYDLTNVGTLFAFALASVGVLVLRVVEPDRPRLGLEPVRGVVGGDHQLTGT